MTIEEYFGTLQQSVIDTWREHLKTSKHNVHVILNDFYEDMPDKVDALIEAWMSHNGKVKDYKNVLEPEDMDPIDYLEQLRDFTKEGRDLMEETELESLVDDILSLIDSTLYKLKELTKTNESYMSLVDYVKESLNSNNKTINESNPRGDYKVIKPFSTKFMWETYETHDNYEDAEEDLQEIYDEVEFVSFLKYAKAHRWKKDGEYYIIPKGTKLYFDHFMRYLTHIGIFNINNDDVYIPMTYDELDFDDYDEYLEEM